LSFPAEILVETLRTQYQKEQEKLSVNTRTL
jgi:hypothetical protein